MSVRRLAEDNVQPATFAFNRENSAWAKLCNQEISQRPRAVRCHSAFDAGAGTGWLGHQGSH